MNIIQIFENNYVDAPTMDTRLTPKVGTETPKSNTLTLDPMQVIGHFLEEYVTTSWNLTYLL